MLYITDIVFSDGHHVEEYSLYARRLTGKILSCDGEYPLPRFKIFDDTDCTLEEIDSQYLIYCYYNLNIQIWGIEDRIDGLTFDDEIDWYTFKLEVGISLPDLKEKLTLVSHIDMLKSRHKLNDHFLHEVGIHDSGDMIKEIVTDSLPVNGVVSDYLIYKVDTVSGFTFYNNLYSNIEEYIKKDGVYYIGGATLIKQIRNDTSVDYDSSREELSIIHRYAHNVVDWLELTFYSPNFIVGCSLKGDLFTIDTLTDRYVYRVDKNLILTLRKCKLLGTTLFGYPVR